jgi:hypothetical protein
VHLSLALLIFYPPTQAKNAILETHMPDFLDLVVWGHEHECKPKPEVGSRKGVCRVVAKQTTAGWSLVRARARATSKTQPQL